MNVIAFPNKLALGARENLTNLVGRARALKVFGPTVDFDSSVWDLSHCVDRKPGSARKTGVLYFTARQDKPTRRVTGRTEMAAPFAEFVKSAIVMKHLAAPTSFTSYGL